MQQRLKSLSITVLTLGIFAAGWTPLHAAPPRLTVVVVVDQMRADYLHRYSREYLGGFARLTREGAVFTQARHGHVPTETSPGHAALLTGCFPSQHGIVGNSWWDRESSQSMYAVADRVNGRSPANLLCPTLGDRLKAVSPRSEVVSISGKDRAAILMGGHKPDMVLWYDETAGQFVSSGYYARLPDWVSNWDSSLLIPSDQRESLTETPLLDYMTLDLAWHAIDGEHLGSRGAADLLTISLSATDHIGHLKGPDSLEMHNQLLALDRELGLFMDRLDQRFGRGQYLFALSSDHGVLPVPESPAGKKFGAVRVDQDEFTGKLESALEARFGAPKSPDKKWVLAVYTPNVYLNIPLAKETGIDPAALRSEAARVLERSAAVAHVFFPEDLIAKAEAARPFADVFARSYHAQRSGDLLILLKEHVLLTEGSSGTAHGLPYDYDARIPMVLIGTAVRAGRYDQEVLSTDLAPTLAGLLGLNFPTQSPSRALQEALKKPLTQKLGGSAGPRALPTPAGTILSSRSQP